MHKSNKYAILEEQKNYSANDGNFLHQKQACLLKINSAGRYYHLKGICFLCNLSTKADLNPQTTAGWFNRGTTYKGRQHKRGVWQKTDVCS